MSLPRCPKRRCREIMIERSGPFGQLDFICVPCEVNEAGFCRRCPKPLKKKGPTNKGRPKYCPSCSLEVEAERDRNRYWNGGKRQTDVERQRRRRDNPVIYADMIEKQRKRHRPNQPRTPIDRAYGRVYAKNRRHGAPRVTVDRRKQVAA